jgi:ornithine carbamoyltransferase
MARRSRVPVVCGGTSSSDPYRVLAEVFGLSRAGADVDSMGVTWMGEPGPRLHSWLEAAVRFGFALEVRLPDGAWPDAALAEYARTRARGSVRISGPLSDPIRSPVVLAADETVYNSVAGTGRVIAVGPERPSAWEPEVDAAVAQGILEEVWVRTMRARQARH